MFTTRITNEAEEQNSMVQAWGQKYCFFGAATSRDVNEYLISESEFGFEFIQG